MTDDSPVSSDPTSTTSDAADADEPTDESGASEVKTAPDGTPIERATSPEQWEAVGRRALADVLRHHRDEIEREIQEAVGAIEYGAPVSEDHVRNLRSAIEGLETVVEHDLADLVDDVEPWARTAERVPYGRMYDVLGVDGDDLDPSADSADDAAGPTDG